jgi:hypothetical protein
MPTASCGKGAGKDFAIRKFGVKVAGMKNTYTVVIVDKNGSTTYTVFANGADDAWALGWSARNKIDNTSVTSVTITKL